MRYAYEIGKIFRQISDANRSSVTETTAGNISARPDLLSAYLRHIDLSAYEIPVKPEGWKSNAEQSNEFWLGYYHEGANARTRMFSQMGSATSEAKSAAARDNGKRGGRPRKEK